MINQQPPLDWRNPWVWAVPLISGTLLALVYGLGVNIALFRLFNTIGPHTWPFLWANITVLGDGMVVLTISLIFVGRRPDLLWALLLAGLVGMLVVHGLKEAIWSWRPPRVLGVENIFVIGPPLVAVSFPSGHSTAAFTLAGLLAQERRWPVPYRLALLAVALTIGISRMVVGVHWPVDVLGGAFIGWTTALLGYVAGRRLSWGTGMRTQRVIVLLLLAAAAELIFWHNSGYTQARWLEISIGIIVVVAALPRLKQLYLPRRSPAAEISGDR